MEFVKPAHLVLLLLIDIMPLLDLHLIGNDKVLLIVLFSQRLFSFFVE